MHYINQHLLTYKRRKQYKPEYDLRPVLLGYISSPKAFHPAINTYQLLNLNQILKLPITHISTVPHDRKVSLQRLDWKYDT